MGDPRKLRKKYMPPKHPWDADRIAKENQLVTDFGLKNKKEIWRADAAIRKFRYLARSLVGIPIDQRKGEEERLMGKLQKLGLLKEGSTLDDALSLKVEDLLARRLQTLVWKRGMANTLSQARQLVAHGHISVKKRRVSSPGMIIGMEEEGTIDWYGEPPKITVKKVEEKPAEKVEKKVEEKPIEKKAPKKARKKKVEVVKEAKKKEGEAK